MKQINVRLSDEAHAALAGMADTDHRSLNSMIIVLIEQEQARRVARAGNRKTN